MYSEQRAQIGAQEKRGTGQRRKDGCKLNDSRGGSGYRCKQKTHTRTNTKLDRQKRLEERNMVAGTKASHFSQQHGLCGREGGR